VNALQSHPDRLRGVAVVSDQVEPSELSALRDAGVRGLRFTELSERVPEFRGTVGYDALTALAPQMRELGLHAQIWTLGYLFAQRHAELLELEVPLVLDHMALFDPTRGVADQPFRALLELLADGKAWVKLIPYRMSARFPDYDDLRPLHEAMLQANPDRLLWGTDWPHVRMTENMPTDAHLLDLFLEWTDNEELARKILVENPSRLYGFSRDA
jgi:predicted TIM-barrel fold metal-dependent hydrolase